mgnify:CR=1 FL=1
MSEVLSEAVVVEMVPNTSPPKQVLAPGTIVKVTKATDGSKWLVGMVLPIHHTDVHDPSLTYSVDVTGVVFPNGHRGGDGEGMYVHDVEVVATPVADFDPKPMADRTDMSALHARIRTLEMEHEQFRTQVREKAIEVAANEGWCDSGLNEALEELGLEPKTRTFDVEVQVTASQMVTIEVEAADEDEAREIAERDMESEIENEINMHDWDIDERNVESVEAQ